MRELYVEALNTEVAEWLFFVLSVGGTYFQLAIILLRLNLTQMQTHLL
jgi:hypothetical protein